MSFKDNIKIKKSLLCILLALQGFLFVTNSQWSTEKIHINNSNSRLCDILDSLSVKCNVNFSYNADIPGIYNIKTIDIESTLEEILKQLLIGENIEFSIVDKQVILYSILSPNPGAPLKIKPLKYIDIEGKVVNAENGTPLSYASVSIAGKNLSTVANVDGDFKIRITSQPNSPDTIVVSYIGFEPYYILIDTFSGNGVVVKLSENVTAIKPVIVKLISGYEIVKDALDAVSKNYSRQNAMYTAFYRETTKNEEEYISVCEAILDIAKAPYKSIFLNDQARIFKGHKNKDTKKLQNLSYKLEGGVYNCLKLDIVKESASFLSYESLNMYDYKLVKTQLYNNRILDVIEFMPKQNISDITFKGSLYIDKESKAIVAAKFSLSEQGLVYAKTLLVRKQPRKAQIKPIEANYLVFYRFYCGKWYLDFTQAELKIKAKSKKSLFNTVFTSVSQMVVTEIDTSNTNRFKWSEIAKSTDVIVENLEQYDDAYWGNYNVIKPEEPIIDAVKRINLKQNLKQNDSGILNNLF
jgi:hypothetical protein